MAARCIPGVRLSISWSTRIFLVHGRAGGVGPGRWRAFGRLGRLAHSVIAMLGLAIAVGVAVLLGARGEDVGPYAPC